MDADWKVGVREAMRDEFVKAQVQVSMPKIEAIMAEARVRGCVEFSCALGTRRGKTVELEFRNPTTRERLRRSLSFTRALIEHSYADGFPLDLGIKCLIQSKILNTEGIELKRRMH